MLFVKKNKIFTKVFILLLLLIVSCGPSEQEIQAQIDEAVETAVEEVLEEVTTTSSSTTTIPPTTTTTTTFPQSVGFVEKEFVGSTIAEFKINYESLTPEEVKNKDDIFTIKFYNGTYYSNYIFLWFYYEGQKNDEFTFCIYKLEEEQFAEPNQLSFGCNRRIENYPNLNEQVDGTYKLRSIILTSDFSGQYYLYNDDSSNDNSQGSEYFAATGSNKVYNCYIVQNNLPSECKLVNTENGVIEFTDYGAEFFKNQQIESDSFTNFTFKIEK